MGTIRGSKLAGSWYSDSSNDLKRKFQKVLNNDNDNLEKSSFVLAPHAGHRFCLPQILSSLKHLDLESNTKSIIVIGPSHKVAFKNKIYLSPFKKLHTPLGDLSVDYESIHKMSESMPKYLNLASESMDQNEHCLEIIYPALKYLVDLKQIQDVKIMPMIISKFDSESVLKNVIKHIFSTINCEDTKVVISSDFTHWGSPYNYYFQIDNIKKFNKYITNDNVEIQLDINKSINLLNLASMLVLSPNQKIDQTVYNKMEMPQLSNAYSASKKGSILHNFKSYLMDTEDTICGMYPIIFVLSILDDEELRGMFKLSHQASFQFIDYNYSNKVFHQDDYRVSYVSGYISN